MVSGTVLLLAALFLMLYNWNQDSRTESRTVSILEQLKEQMPEAHFAKNEFPDASPEIQELLEKAVDKAILCNVSHDELNEMLALLYEEKSGR